MTKRRWFIFIWLVLPVGFAIFHFGPGNDMMALDKSVDYLKQAEQLRDTEDFESALESYNQALSELPPEKTQARRKLELARSYAKMRKGDIVEAMNDMKSLLKDVSNDPNATDIERRTRSQLARTQYYIAWIMRLERAKTAEWHEPIEESRQNFRLLAESALKQGNTRQAEKYQKDLESAIYLQRMDIKDLIGLPLPKEGKGAAQKGDVGKKMQEAKGEGKQPGEGKGKGQGQGPPKDGRGDPASGAGSGNVPEFFGS